MKDGGCGAVSVEANPGLRGVRVESLFKERLLSSPRQFSIPLFIAKMLSELNVQ